MSNFTDLQRQVDELSHTVSELTSELDVFYLFWAAVLVFNMQMGFAMLSAGAVRKKNVTNILLKGLLDACLGAIIWYLFGYGFAYDADVGKDGHEGNAFIGSGPSNFALSGLIDDQGPHGSEWVNWFFQYAFAAAAATIVSGAVAERCMLSAYLIYTTALTGFIYPVVVHWVWDPIGFLSAGNEDSDVRWLTGVIDFAGSGVVHMTGGWAALVSAKVLGPRRGRFGPNGEVEPGYSGHSIALTVLGTFILWVGWYGFNQGSTLALSGQAQTAARVGVTTTLSGATAGVVGLYIKRVFPPFLGGAGHVWDLGHTCNSVLAGLVAVTAGCATIEPYSAVIIGFIAAFVYHGASCMMRQLKIDDPLDAFAVHGANGFWGVLAVGFFTTEAYTYAYNDDGEKEWGCFTGGGGLLLASQLVGLCIMIVWVLTMSIILFNALHFAGIFRVPLSVEEIGLDVSKHGGSAYPGDDPRFAFSQAGIRQQSKPENVDVPKEVAENTKTENDTTNSTTEGVAQA